MEISGSCIGDSGRNFENGKYAHIRSPRPKTEDGYDYFVSCTWTTKIPSGNALLLNFTNFEIDTTREDRFWIYEGTKAEGTPLVEVTSFQDSSSSIIPSELWFNVESIYIRFIGHAWTNLKGFMILLHYYGQ